MKKLLAFLISLVLILTYVVTVQGQPPFNNCASGVSAINLHSDPITINASYWDNVSGIYVLPSSLVDPLKNIVYFNEPTLLFNGSAILTSNDGRLGAYTNETCNNNQRGAAYDGVERPTKTAYYPLMLNQFFGQTTFVSIQNTDTTQSTNVDFIFTEQGGVTFTKTFSINAGLTKFYDPSDDLTFPFPWIGSAIVKSSDTNIAGIGLNYTANNMGMYTALTGSDNRFYLPLIRSNFSGFTTGSQVGSVANITSTVTMTYSGIIYNAAFLVLDPDYDCVIEATVPPQSSLNFFNGFTTPFTQVTGSISANKIDGQCFDNNDLSFADSVVNADKFLGGGTVTSEGDITAIVNDAGGNSAGIYNGFMKNDASDYIVSPLSRVYFPVGIVTGHQIQNICSYAVTVNVLYITNTDLTAVPAPTAGPFVIQAGKSATAFIEPGTGFDGWIGTFTAKTQGGERCIVGITNDQVEGFDSSVFNLIKINE